MKTRKKKIEITIAAISKRINLAWLMLLVGLCCSMPVKAQCEAPNEAFKSGAVSYTHLTLPTNSRV